LTSVDFEHRFNALVACSPDAIFITDFDSARFVDVNLKACELFGYTREQLCGMTGRQLHPPEDTAVVDAISRDLIEHGQVRWSPVRLRKQDGETFFGELRSTVYRAEDKKLYVTLVRDISARLSREVDLQAAYRALSEIESHLVRSSRLAAIGEIAAGIAHEVNNPAASTLTNLELLQGDLAKLVVEVHAPDRSLPSLVAALDGFCAEAGESVRDSFEGIQRIAFIVRGLRGFARIDGDDVENVDVNEVVKTAYNLVRPQIRHVARVDLALTASETLPASRGRLIQVVVNLLLNAAQAIDEGGGGTIQVVTSNTSDGVLLRVEDDGPGVPPAIAPRIFDPFFTTKGADRGTGLGLSVCADIIHRHRGTLRLRQGGLKGACLEAVIPLETGLAPEVAPRTSLPPSGPPLRILVIDDEVILIRAYRRLLGRCHEVVASSGGEEALSILASDRNFDVILCDLMMPGTDGVDIYEALERMHPELVERVAFVTGGPTSARAQNFLRRPGIVSLDKPISSAALAHYIASRQADKQSPADTGRTAPGRSSEQRGTPEQK
jgi:two-component system, NtrC family, sensor kinase